MAAGQVVDGLPEFSLNEVVQHKTPETGVWVTYKDGVYDITEFALRHPGGARIMLAAGAGIEPFWAMYAAHQHQEVLKILESLRIGNVAKADRDARQSGARSGAASNDPYAGDPARHPVLKVNSATPFNAETPLPLLADSFITPNALFYVRNHLPVPDVKEDEYVLEVSGVGIPTPLRLTLQDLRERFPKRTVVSTVQCAGNRRHEMKPVRPVKGLDWTGGAIGTAEWAGVYVTDLLHHAGYDLQQHALGDAERTQAQLPPPSQQQQQGQQQGQQQQGQRSTAQHVHFEGLDKDMTGTPYGASVPMDRCADRRNEVLIAYEMNGEPLPPDHGFPVRAVVPGVVGARNVKWLGRIVTSEREYGGFWQQNDYKGFSPSVTYDNVDYSKAVAIQELPVQSAICQPSEGEEVEVAAADSQRSVPVKGYAWSGGGRGILRVDVSADGGNTWHEATLRQPPQPLSRAWAWTLWEAEVPVPAEAGEHVQLMCKAVDASYNVQPDTVAPIWNLRGVLSNAWHRVTVRVRSVE